MSIKDLFVVALVLIWLVVVYYCSIYSFVDYYEIQRLSHIVYHEFGFYTFHIRLQPGAFVLLKKVLLTVGGITTGLTLFLFYMKKELRDNFYLLGLKLVRICKTLQATFLNLTLNEKLVATLVLMIVSGIHLFYLFCFPLLTDEIASYDDFIMEGIVAVTSFYPIPNNHVFFNMLCLLVYQFTTNPEVVMRLPSFFFSFLGTCIFYLILIKAINFRSTTIVISLFNLSYFGIRYAFEGRGYTLQMVLAVIGFFSLLKIIDGKGAELFYWVLLIIANVLGLYTVPTHIYAFVSTFIIGGVYFLLTKSYANVLNLILSGLIVCCCTILLYLPMIFVSGLEAIVSNKYVVNLSYEQYWSKFIPVTRFTEGMLVGKPGAGAEGIALIILVFLAAAIFFNKSKDFIRVGFLAIGMIILPLVLSALQRVYVPDRSLFYKSFFIFLLVAITFDFILSRIKIPEWLKVFSILVSVSLFAGYEIYQTHEVARPTAIEEMVMRDTYEKLISKMPKHVFVQSVLYQAYFNHYAKSTGNPMKIYSEKQKGQVFDFVVLEKDKEAIDKWQKNNFVKVSEHEGALIMRNLH